MMRAGVMSAAISAVMAATMGMTGVNIGVTVTTITGGISRFQCKRPASLETMPSGFFQSGKGAELQDVEVVQARLHDCRRQS